MKKLTIIIVIIALGCAASKHTTTSKTYVHTMAGETIESIATATWK